MKIVFAAPQSAAQLQELAEKYPGTQFVSAAMLEEQLAELPDADGMISWPRREALPVARRLRWVHVLSAGIERIASLPELIENDQVVVTNARGAHGSCIADHCFALILTLTRCMRELEEDRCARRWDRGGRSRHMRELSGSTLGILGLGQIGSEIARRGVGFGMRVLAIDVNPAATAPGVEAVWPLDRLDDLLRETDYLAIALPITAATRGLVDARRLALMKPDAYLFVLSRGGIVDQDALAAALRDGRLAGAGLDATAPEPLPDDSPLWDLPNVLISPHCSGASVQTSARGRAILQENIRRFVAGEPLLNVCDKRAGF